MNEIKHEYWKVLTTTCQVSLKNGVLTAPQESLERDDFSVSSGSKMTYLQGDSETALESEGLGLLISILTAPQESLERDNFSVSSSSKTTYLRADSETALESEGLGLLINMGIIRI
jgi:hypothetical protein